MLWPALTPQERRWLLIRYGAPVMVSVWLGLFMATTAFAPGSALSHAALLFTNGLLGGLAVGAVYLIARFIAGRDPFLAEWLLLLCLPALIAGHIATAYG